MFVNEVTVDFSCLLKYLIEQQLAI
jgi:hypothetical protein